MKRNLWQWSAAGAALLVLLAAAVWVMTRTAGHEAHTSGADTMTVSSMETSGMTLVHDDVVNIDLRLLRALGITTVPVELGTLDREIRTTGNVIYDETRLSTITSRVGGFVERLHVGFTGQAVRRGQPLLELYSPELVAAQEELLAAIRLERQLAQSVAPGVAERSGSLVEAARRRLILWEISRAQIDQVERSGEVRRTLTLHAPAGGFVIEKSVQAGQSVQPGEALYRLADLSQVWIEADVYEQDLRAVKRDQRVDVEVGAYPGERFAGRISYIHPDVRPDTRTARVRVQLVNTGGRLKPGMFATVRIDAPTGVRGVLVPRDAVMRTGTSNIVFVEQRPGQFEKREVHIGSEAGAVVQVLTGLQPGERVAGRANFILDAESRLMEGMSGDSGAAGGSMDGMDMPDMHH